MSGFKFFTHKVLLIHFWGTHNEQSNILRQQELGFSYHKKDPHLGDFSLQFKKERYILVCLSALLP